MTNMRQTLTSEFHRHADAIPLSGKPSLADVKRTADRLKRRRAITIAVSITVAMIAVFAASAAND